MKKFHFIVLLSFCIVYVSCKQPQQYPCENFKKGKYAMHSEYDGTNILIDRKDSFQVETVKETGRTAKWKINWTNDCEYTLLLMEDNAGTLEKSKTAPLYTFKIEMTTKEYYIFTTTFNTAGLLVRDTIQKVD